MTHRVEHIKAEAVAQALRDYRLARGRRTPLDAAAAGRDGAAVHLANHAVDGQVTPFALEFYRTARGIYREVCRRADIGSGSGRKFNELTRTEQFWSTGDLAGVSA